MIQLPAAGAVAWGGHGEAADQPEAYRQGRRAGGVLLQLRRLWWKQIRDRPPCRVR